MSGEAWLWAGALSLVAFVMGVKVGVDWSVRCFVRRLIEYGLIGVYSAAMDAHAARKAKAP